MKISQKTSRNNVVTPNVKSRQAVNQSISKWETWPINECLAHIVHFIGKIVKGSEVFYTKCYLVLLILLVFVFVFEIRRITMSSFLKWVALGLLLIMPFAIGIYMGIEPVARSQSALGMVQAAGIMFVYQYAVAHKNMAVRTGMLLATCVTILLTIEKQIYITSKIYYTDDIRYNDDMFTLQQILKDIDDLNIMEAKPLIFIEKRAPALNASCYDEYLNWRKKNVVSLIVLFFNEDTTTIFYKAICVIRDKLKA